MVPDQHRMVGFKVLRSFYSTCGESVNSAECKTNRLAVLTVKSGLDPHMIIELKDGLKSWLCLSYAYGVSLTFVLNVGLYILTLY
jgi:hypothetical protein